MELILVPTAHVSKKSIELVKKTINEEKPDLIAVELDKQRAMSLLSGKKPDLLTLLKNPGFLFMYSAQQIIGFILKSTPGEEMKTALLEAGKNNIPILLSDLPIQYTMQNLKKIPFREKLKLITPMKIKGIDSIEKLTNPKELRPLLIQIKERYPNTYKYLIEDRNNFIFNKIINSKQTKIVGVYGAGHIPGLEDLIKEYNLINLENKIQLKVIG
ncbi:MAG: TraB/GumN family protein [Candidatus Micrarchaeia archaeon]|jgi:pheromone shutdown protein TraB